MDRSLLVSSGRPAAATFEGEFSDVTHSYASKGVMRYVGSAATSSGIATADHPRLSKAQAAVACMMLQCIRNATRLFVWRNNGDTNFLLPAPPVD
jgi:hypothetical protein